MGNYHSLPSAVGLKRCCSQCFWCCDECWVQPKPRSAELNAVTLNPISSGLVMAPADQLDCKWKFQIVIKRSENRARQQLWFCDYLSFNLFRILFRFQFIPKKCNHSFMCACVGGCWTFEKTKSLANNEFQIFSSHHANCSSIASHLLVFI